MFSYVFVISLGTVFAGHLENGTLHSSRRSNDYLIMGGRVVDIEEYPYQVSIQYSKIHVCGGCIISEKYILTAAHCLSEGQEKNYRVRYGSSNKEHGGKFTDIKMFLRHHKYDYKLFDYDIAIVELSKCLVFDAKCQPIRLPEGSQVIADGTLLTVSGYGRLYDRDEDETFLRAVKVPKVNQTFCSEIWHSEENIRITPRMICAGYEKGGKDACSGDSGGPLVLGYTLVGLVSFGPPCEPSGIPAVYTSIAPLLCWIRENTVL